MTPQRLWGEASCECTQMYHYECGSGGGVMLVVMVMIMVVVMMVVILVNLC